MARVAEATMVAATFKRCRGDEEGDPGETDEGTQFGSMGWMQRLAQRRHDVSSKGRTQSCKGLAVVVAPITMASISMSWWSREWQWWSAEARHMMVISEGARRWLLCCLFPRERREVMDDAKPILQASFDTLVEPHVSS
ncbi:hypothetical protein DEO72_LG11g1618 [Vigna unguiculata]|uniref:Uncharacterized protein n=1 Tax=Vigna unguiculata TaxID=3917 RepID=A0A4D6NQQ9_VIGUN|nr:hypothetical protein DEO72_LG11g1618 [Vigna unguiculata]